MAVGQRGGCAAIRVPVAHLDGMLVKMILMGMMQMPVMDVVEWWP